MKKMSLILVLFLLLQPLSVFASDYSFGYTIGAQVYEMTIANDEEEFYLPFDSDYLQINYNVVGSASIQVSINDETELLHNAEDGSSSAIIYFPEIIRKGDCKIKFNCSGVITVSSVVFHKIPESVSYIGPVNFTAEQRPEVAFTDYEDAVRTAVIINIHSPVIKVYGANRYINYNNPKENPYYENGIVYLPIHTFSRAFGYYYEQTENKFILRADNVEFVYNNHKLYKQTGYGKYVEISNNTLQINDNVYIPVKYYAEAIGKTVLTKDDYMVIDWRDLAKNIVSDDIFELVKEDFSKFFTVEEQTVYYVAQTEAADDDNPGTYDRPFATLSKVCEVADAGDRVIVGSGVYKEILNPRNNGTANNPIIFEAEEGGNVTISALESIGIPDYQENGLCVYNVDWDLGDGRNQVFYNGEALAEARHPNSHTSRRYYPQQLDLSPLWPTQGNIQVTLSGTADTATSTTDLNQPDNYWVGGTLVTLHGRGYGVATAKITASESSKLYLGKKSTRLWHTVGGDDSDSHFDFAYITNTKNAIDVPGEWFWGDGKLYIKPPKGKNARTLNLEAKKRQITVDLADNEYIHLVGINTIGGGMKLNNSQMCVINGGTHKYISHFTYTDDTENGFIDSRDSVHDIYDSDTAVYRGEVGFYLGGKNNAVLNSTILYSAAGGICLSGSYSYVENNFISECGYMGGGTNGVYIFCSPLDDITKVRGGHSLYANTIEKTGRASLNLSSWTYPLAEQEGLAPWVACDIAYNDFLNANISTRDNGAIYAYGSVLGDERRKLQFHNNIIGNSWVTDGYAAGIYWDNYSQMVECYNNIVFYDNSKISTDESYLHIARLSKYPNSFSYVNAWNNINAGYSFLGKFGLSLNDYPLQKWFSTGCSLTNQVSLKTENNTMFEIFKADAASEQVTYDKYGAACLNESGQWLCFESIDFGDDSQALCLYYSGDRYNTGDRLLVATGTHENADYQEVTVKCTASFKDSINEIIVPINNIQGIHDVYIKCLEYKSAGIWGINVQKRRASVNNAYSLIVTDENDQYYISGNSGTSSSVIGAITDYQESVLLDVDKYETNESGEFNLVLNKPNSNGAYQFKIFSWNDLRPLNKAFQYTYAENRFKDAFGKIKFKEALNPRLISDGSVVGTYGNDSILFENVDFGNSDVKSLAIKYGINESEKDKLTVKVYLDSTETSPIWTFTPESTGERWNRQEFIYNLYSLEPPIGVHNVYFVIEGSSSLPMHLERFSFGDKLSADAKNKTKDAFEQIH